MDNGLKMTTAGACIAGKDEIQNLKTMRDRVEETKTRTLNVADRACQVVAFIVGVWPETPPECEGKSPDGSGCISHQVNGDISMINRSLDRITEALDQL